MSPRFKGLDSAAAALDVLATVMSVERLRQARSFSSVASEAFMPPYSARHLYTLAPLKPYVRNISFNAMPASTCRRKPMICSFLFEMSPPLLAQFLPFIGALSPTIPLQIRFGLFRA